MAITKKTSQKRMEQALDRSLDVSSLDKVVPINPDAPTKNTGVTRARAFARIELSRIVPDAKQPRTHFDKEAIESLSESMQSDTGQIQPVVVKWSPEHNRYQLVSGERRFRAAQLAGWTMLDCKILTDDTSDQRIRQTQLAENLKREDLKPLEEARAINEFKAHYGLSGKQTAKELGISEARVSRSIGLLQLPDEIQGRIASGEIPRTLAYELLQLKSTGEIEERLKDKAEKAHTGAVGAAKVSKKRKRKKRHQSKARLTFECAHGVTFIVEVDRQLTYHHIKEAAEKDLVEEVELRIRNNVQIL